MTGYYDVLLVLMPVALLGLSGALLTAGVALTNAVMLGGLVAVGLMGHGLFVNDPSPPTREPRSRGFESAD